MKVHPDRSETKKKETFVLELPLWIPRRNEKPVESTFEASRQLQNACLSEALRRKDLMIQSKLWQQARELPRGSAERAEAFREAKKRYGFAEYDLHAYAAKVKNSWIGEHIGIHVAQTLATRAFQAVEKVLLGEAKRVRFKGKNQLDSIEGKNNQTGLIWKGTYLKMGKLELDVVPEVLSNQRDPVIAHGLMQKVKYCRLVRRRRKDRTFYYVQLVCEGFPLSLKERKLLKSKNGTYQLPPESSTTGVDIGPSTIAIVTETEAHLKVFCEELKDYSAEITIEQRKLDRQRRANNPDNYNENGTIKAGPKEWKKSERQLRTEQKIRELYRKQAEYRDSLHGYLINTTIPLESLILLEELSYKGFQKRFGKSVGMRAPGGFVQKLIRKAENANGSVVAFPTVKTRLSQACLCGRVKKKLLSQRWHVCECGIQAQRDLFSAFLARHVQENQLNATMAQEQWRGAEKLLQTAYEQAIQTASGRKTFFPSSFGKPPKAPEKSCSSEKGRTTCKRRQPEDKAWDDVGSLRKQKWRAQESPMDFSPRTRQL